MTTASRLGVISACLFGAAAYAAFASKTEAVPLRQPLSAFPSAIGSWNGLDQRAFDKSVLDVLKVDDYISRVYRTSANGHVELYIGYYESQRQGETIHSPLNCLPGAGWFPVSRGYVTIPVSSESSIAELRVNQYVVQKGLDQQVVLYWYQSHGRVIANEYASKLFMVYDALRLNRTDAALVRVMSPRIGSGPDAESAAAARAVAFVQAMFPTLAGYLPS